MRKKKVVIQTNSPLLKTGLAEHGRALANYLHKTGKYEIVYYCTQTSAADPAMGMLPWKAYGAIPNDPAVIQQLNSDMVKARDASYGSLFIDHVIKTEKPDVWIESDDIWSTSRENYLDKPWFKKINAILHKTVDSVPVLDQAFEQAKANKHYVTWAKFASKEMKRFGPDFQHIGQIYGAVDTKDFVPLTDEGKKMIRDRFGIKKDTLIIGKLGRNQLRKEFGSVIAGFADFKKENPTADVKLHFHTSFGEKGSGWDIERLAKYHGVNTADILCTYVCKDCGDWYVEPYKGEDVKCMRCGSEKGRITANIGTGVPNEEMKFLYGLWDAGINAMTSGGQEYTCVNTLMCGLPLGCTNYASGEDFCEQPFVTAINYEKNFEAGTSFQKSRNSIKSIKNFIEKIYRMSAAKRKEIGMQGYQWAKKTFSIDVLGPQWEKILDAMPEVNWDGFSFEVPPKDEQWKLPDNYKSLPEEDFITMLYREVLKMEEGTNGDGRKNWRTQLANGVPREQVHEFFLKAAFEENQKNRKIDFWDLLDRSRPNKRALLVIKESIGDCLLVTQLFESFHAANPGVDLYIATEPKYFDVFVGNPYVHKILPYQGPLEQEMAMTGAGMEAKDMYFHYFLHPAIGSQRLLNYLNSPETAYDLPL